jgi:hypothetical protein
MGMPRRNIYEQKGKHPSYMFRYCHKDSVNLLNLLYTGVKDRLYLERKYSKFKKGVNNGKAG